MGPKERNFITDRLSSDFLWLSGLQWKARSPSYEVSVVDAPDIGKCNSPDPSQLRPGKSKGATSKPKNGVNLEAQATKPVVEGRLILNQRDQLPLEVEGERLKGNLLVFYSGTYSVSIRDELGFDNKDRVQYRIILIPDEYPEAEILSPTEDGEVSGDEVLPVLYAARDDFGLTGIRLIYQKTGTERSISLRNPGNSTSAGPEIFKWDLASLALTPGDRVNYRIEAWDNDSLSGPKSGYSKTFTLRMRDLKGRAAEEAQRGRGPPGPLGRHLERQRPQCLMGSQVMEKVDKHLIVRGRKRSAVQS
jgi:hypothetical protein